MTGKELVLVLGGAAALGGGAVATHALLQPAAQAPVAQMDTSELDARMESLEKTQARTAKSLDRLGDKLDRLTDTLARTQTETARLREEVRRQGPGGSTAHDADGSFSPIVRRMGEADESAQIDFQTVEEEIGGRLGKLEGLKMLPEGFGEELDKALEGLEIDFGQESVGLRSMLKGMELRQLPEAERWQKARDDLRLTDTQVEDLKAATADLDTAMDAAMVTEERDFGNGQKFTLKRTDFEKAREAREAYRERVDRTLDTDQQKTWRESGYDNAFGRAGGSHSFAVTTINTMSLGGSSDEASQSDESTQERK